MSNQPEALRVAQALESDWRVNLASNRDAARLLREQHEEIQRLRSALKRIETLKVAIDGWPATAYQTEGWMRELAREALEVKT